MPGVKLSFTDTNNHNLFDVLTGTDVTGVSASEKWNSTSWLGTVFDLLYQTPSTNNSGGVLIGDGTMTASIFGEKIVPGDASFKPEKSSIAGTWVRASASGDILNLSWTIGIG